MTYIVQKFGGTSVGDIGRIEHVANIIASEVKKKNKVKHVKKNKSLTKILDFLSR